MIIDCISDLHGYYPTLEGGDLLIVAGDLTARDTILEYKEFDLWLAKQKYKHKIIIAGNHDNFIQRVRDWNGFEEIKGGIYLCDSGTEFEGFKIWGSPWTKRFEGMNPKAMAFTVDTDDELAEKWALIPEDTDILITHSPPKGMRDLISRKENVGSLSLVRRLTFLTPKLHVFGHVHEGYGEARFHIKNCAKSELKLCYLVNASHVNERYEPVNKPIRIEL